MEQIEISSLADCQNQNIMNEFIPNYGVPFLIISLQIILFILLKNVVSTYINEKSKNQATKEDIGGITKEVEQVKYLFNEQSEKVKAKLSLLTNVSIGLFSQERETIIEYIQKYFKWYNLLIDGRLGLSNFNNNDDLKQYLKIISIYYEQYIDSQTKLGLFFINDLDLLGFANSVRMLVYEKLHFKTPIFVMDLININREIEIIRTKMQPTIINIDKISNL